MKWEALLWFLMKTFLDHVWLWTGSGVEVGFTIILFACLLFWLPRARSYERSRLSLLQVPTGTPPMIIMPAEKKNWLPRYDKQKHHLGLLLPHHHGSKQSWSVECLTGFSSTTGPTNWTIDLWEWTLWLMEQGMALAVDRAKVTFGPFPNQREKISWEPPFDSRALLAEMAWRSPPVHLFNSSKERMRQDKAAWGWPYCTDLW